MEQLDPRYGPNWRLISIKAKQQIPVCCFCLKRRSQETHHVRYCDTRGQLLGDKIILGVDIFPVCPKCHDVLHYKRNWKTYRDNTKNRNSDSMVFRLQFGYNFLSGVI